MSPVRELLMSVEPDVHEVNPETGQLFNADGEEVHPVDGNTKLEVTVSVLRDLNRDVALLGMCLAQKYRKESEYHTAYEVLARDMVRLYNTIETLTEIKTVQDEQSQEALVVS